MKGDFSRARLDQDQNHSRALLQQGRPLIDSDWNEQIQILWESQRTIFGPREHGYLPPVDVASSTSFKIELDNGALKLRPGTYVFDGRVIRNRKDLFATAFTEIAGRGFMAELDSLRKEDPQPKLPNGKFVAALVAYERELFYEESEMLDPRLAELRASVRTKMDWGMFLVSVEDGKSFEEKRAELNAETDCAFTDPPPLHVTVPQRTFDTKADYLYRVEIHSITKKDATHSVTIKLTEDNAAYSLPIANFDDATISLNTRGVDPSQLPVGEDWVEIESLVRLPWVSGEPAPLLKVKEYEDGRIQVESSPPAEQHSQLTRWKFVAKDVKDASVIREFDTLMNVQFMADQDVKMLKSGDWWEILIRTAPKPDKDGVPVKFPVRGYRQSPYYAPLADITVDNDGTTNIDANPRRMLSTFGNPPHALACPKPSPAMPAPLPTPVAATPTIDHALLDELACRKVFTSLQSLAANRWLASAKFGEIATLSRAELRARIERDCPPGLYDDQSLDQDVTNILATRQEVLAGRSMIT